MNDIRTERIFLRNMQLRDLALSPDSPDHKDIVTVILVFEAKGELLSLEEWGNPWLRQFPSFVSNDTLEELITYYRDELKTLPLIRVRASDPDASQMELSLARRKAIDWALLVLQRVVLERGIPPVQLSGFSLILNELNEWDRNAKELVDPALFTA